MKVLIKVIRKTEYASIVDMDEATFKRLQLDLEGGRVERRSAEVRINNLIDTKDWQDDDLDSIEEFEPYPS